MSAARNNESRGENYGAYHDGLVAEMARRTSLLYLAHYLRYFGRRRYLLPYTARDAKAPDVKAIHARGCDWTWHQRQWDYREHARAIIEGSEPWPRRLLPWKTRQEYRYYHGGPMPGWLDPENAVAPSHWNIPGSTPLLASSKKRASQ